MYINQQIIFPMIKKYILILSLFISTGFTEIFANNINDTNFTIKYYDLDLKINTSNSDFFTGVLKVSKDGKNLFSMDSVFTDYVEHKLIDLNGDGSNELLLYLSEGASPYIFHMLYIFDRKKDFKPLFMIQNGDVDTTSGNSPKILAIARMSPAVIGLWYFWYLEYKNGNLVYWKPDAVNRVKLHPDIGSIVDNLKEIYTGKESCEDYIYSAFFENVFISYKISGEDYLAEEFFYKNYKCEEKIKALKNFKSIASDTYKWIKDKENYKYSEF